MILSLRLHVSEAYVKVGRTHWSKKELCFKVLWKFGVKDITKFSKCRPSELNSSGDLRFLTVLIEEYSLSWVFKSSILSARTTMSFAKRMLCSITIDVNTLGLPFECVKDSLQSCCEYFRGYCISLSHTSP